MQARAESLREGFSGPGAPRLAGLWAVGGWEPSLVHAHPPFLRVAPGDGEREGFPRPARFPPPSGARAQGGRRGKWVRAASPPLPAQVSRPETHFSPSHPATPPSPNRWPLPAPLVGNAHWPTKPSAQIKTSPLQGCKVLPRGTLVLTPLPFSSPPLLGIP